MNRPIFIPYETKVREFDGKLLLICHLLKAGFSEIYFGSRSGVKSEAIHNRNGLYIFKGVSKIELEFYRELKNRGYITALLDAEGGIFYKEISSEIVSAYNPDVMQYIDVNFLFGQFIKDAIDQYCGTLEKTKLVITGEPRFDLLKPKYAPFFKPQLSELKQKYGSFLLFNTNFSTANPVVGTEKLKEFFMNEPTYTEEAKALLMEKITFLRGVLNDYLEAIKKIATTFPSENFVIRAHPSESEQPYIDAFKNLPNVFVTKQGNVAEWILASDGVIHYDCTTGMEARLAKKTVISYLPQKNDKVLAWLPVELSIKTSDLPTLVAKTRDLLNHNLINSDDPEIFAQWQSIIHNVSHESSPIAAEELSKYREIPAMANRSAPLRKKIDLFIYRLKAYAFAFLTRNSKKVNISKEKFGTLTVAEVATKLKSLLGIENAQITFQVKKIRPDVVVIRLK